MSRHGDCDGQVMGNLVRRQTPSSGDNDEVAEQRETSLTRTILTASVVQLQQRLSHYHRHYRHYRHYRHQAGGGDCDGEPSNLVFNSRRSQ